MSSYSYVREKLSELVADETYQDIEEFLAPRFDVNTIGKKKRRWKIVCDGHGKWHEIKPRINNEEKQDYAGSKNDPVQKSLTRTGKLLFSNNILGSVRCSSELPTRGQTSSSVPGRDYRTLSTTMRSNIFPGIGNYDWHSQSNVDYCKAALNLGKHRSKDLKEEFYGIKRDEMGAWNEASVHHERMKKSWDVYLESLATAGRVAAQMQKSEKSIESNVHEYSQKAKKTGKQVKKTDKGKKDLKLKVESLTDDNELEVKLSEQPLPPKLSKTAEDDEDFWDFYDQPFVK